MIVPRHVARVRRSIKSMHRKSLGHHHIDENLVIKLLNATHDRIAERLILGSDSELLTQEIWNHTQNPLRFPGVTLVVITYFRKRLQYCHKILQPNM